MVEKKHVLIMLGLAIVLGAIYYFPQVSGPGGLFPSKNATAILLLAIDKAVKTTTYVMESSTSIDGSEPIYSRATVSGSSARIDILDSLGVPRSIYLLPEGEFVCLPERKACVKIDRNATFSKLRNMVSYARDQVVVVNASKVKEWVSLGVIEVRNQTNGRKVANRSCEELVYDVHFDKMHGADLAAVGIDAAVAPYVSRQAVQCLDDETGFMLYWMQNTSVLGELSTREMNVTLFEPGTPVGESEFGLVGGLINETNFLSLDGEEIERKSCLLLSDERKQEGCFEEKALGQNSPAYCDLIESVTGKDRCYMLFVPLWKDARLCDRVELLRDDCLYEVGLLTSDAEQCEKIAELERRQLCKVILSGDVDACAGRVFADECVAAIARKTGNVTLCVQIVDEKTRQVCLGG